MGLQASNQTGTATAALLLGAGTFNTSLREFLALKPGLTGYGIDIPRVQEIRSDEESIRVANAPAFVKGLVNLRGAIVPASTCDSSSTSPPSATPIHCRDQAQHRQVRDEHGG